MIHGTGMSRKVTVGAEIAAADEAVHSLAECQCGAPSGEVG